MFSRSEYTLFLDESGKTSFRDDSDEERFLICGVIIDKSLHEALSHYMLSLKEKSGIPPHSNIHAYDLFEKEEINDGPITYLKIGQFFTRFAHLIEGAEFKTILVEISKKEYKEKISKMASKYGVTVKPVLKHLKKSQVNDFLYESLTRKIILEFGNFLEKNNAVGDIVAESRRGADSSVLKGFVDSTDSKLYSEGSQYCKWSKSGFERINSLTFQNKKGLSFGLEAADFFAWAYFNTNYFYRKQSSEAKNKRVRIRLRKGIELLSGAYLNSKMPEYITPAKLRSIASNRVSLFNDELNKFNI
jgi:Protein of unknown function (DUF3800)